MDWLGLPEHQGDSFVAFTFVWLVLFALLMLFATIVFMSELHPIKQVWAWSRIPCWLALLGTIGGMVGASRPVRAAPDPEMSIWRDKVSLAGWVLLFFGALSALLYV